MVMGEKREMMKPLLLKLGVGLVLSFAGYLYKTHIRNQSTCWLRRPSADDKVVGSGRSGLKGEFCGTQSSLIELGNEEKSQKDVGSPFVGFYLNKKSSRDEECFLLPDMESTTSKITDREAMVKEQEIINLRNMVRVLQERERNKEIQILEYYGLKEQEAIIQELHNRLKINVIEAKLFNLKIESLNAENRTIKAQAAEYSRVMVELESTKAKIKLLRRKMRSDAEQANQQLFDLQQKVLTMQNHEQEAALNEADVQEKLLKLKDLEDELSELRTDNSRLQHEKSELTMKPESTQVIAPVLNGPEARVLEEANQLGQTSDDLEKENLNHWSDAQEMVYLKWVNACLRYELRNYRDPSGKTTAKNLSNTQSPKSEQKAKELILEYSNSGIDENSSGLVDFDSEYCLSSQASNLTETGECYDTPTDTSSNKQNNGVFKQKIFKKVTRLFSGKNNHDDKGRISSVERTSTSCATSARASTSAESLDDTTGTCLYDSASSCTTTEHAITNLHFHDSSISAMQRK